MDIKVNIPIAPPILHCHTTDMNIVEKFLHDVNMHPDAVDMDREIESLMDEMGKGLRGEKSSLPMIPTYIEAQADIPLDTPAVVLDAGGTNLRAAQITLRQTVVHGLKISTNKPCPVRRGTRSAEKKCLTHWPDWWNHCS